MNSFSEMLKYLRKREGLTQQELSQKLKISKSTISMYENGNREPDFETLEMIADFFNVDMNFLMGKPSNSIPKVNTLAAHFEGEEFSEEEMDEIKNFVEFVKNKRK